MTSEKSPMGTYFMVAVLAAYGIVLLLDPASFAAGIESSGSIFVRMAPVFVFVFLIMAAFNYFVTPRQMAEHLGKRSGAKGWIIAVVTGIISTGPIYMWYPLLNDLQKKGVRNGLIATFLYNRAVKVPLLPMIIMFFGLKYTIILTAVMIITSLLQGMIVEKLLEVKK